jgi:hypothetical protein
MRLPVLLEPPLPYTPAPLRSVQHAIAADVRGRLAETWLDETDDGSRLVLAAGAGALLTSEAFAGLAGLFGVGSTPLRLPVGNFERVDGAEAPRSGATCFAAQEGADLAPLELHSDTGPAARAAVESLAIDTSPLRAALPLLGDRDAEIAVAGDLPAHTWKYIEDQVACRVRVFGVRSARRGRSECDLGKGTPDLLRALYGRVAGEEFLAAGRELGQAVFLDTRRFMPGASVEDYYWSDLRQPGNVAHAGLRALTELGLSAAYPFILCGPSFMSGGFYAVVEAAWRVVPDLDLGYKITW